MKYNLADKKNFFNEKGFVEFENFFTNKEFIKIKSKYKKIFNGTYETGVIPDKVKWIPGQHKNNIPRSVCNAWKSDYDVAKVVLSEKLGKITSLITGWKSVKVNQDSLIWVVPKAGSVAFHQDNPYQDWHLPGGVVTAWIPLNDTVKEGATLEYLEGSHKQGAAKRLKNFFKNKNYRYIDKKYIKNVKNYKRYFAVAKSGSLFIHHGNIWHGSGFNKTKKERISLSIHLMNGSSKFHKTIKSPYFNHYKLDNTDKMLDCFFPTVWSSNKNSLKFKKKYLSSANV